MQGNDIGNFADVGQGVVFEGLIAVPPPKRLFQRTSDDWDKELHKWKANELPLKALIDTSDRLGVSTEVYTFLGEDAGYAIERWLQKKGISLGVYSYENIDELAYDLRFKRSIRTIYVPEEEQARVIGIRSCVVDPKKAWTL